jgi:hypothetical protein
VNSLRTLLADIPETCYLFAYEFALNGKALNDFHPLPEEAYVAGTKLIVQTSTCFIHPQSRTMMQRHASTSAASEKS